MATIGTDLASLRFKERIAIVAWLPFIIGICISIKIRLKWFGSEAWNMFTASLPFTATSISTPVMPRISFTISQLISLSSTISILLSEKSSTGNAIGLSNSSVSFPRETISLKASASLDLNIGFDIKASAPAARASSSISVQSYAENVTIGIFSPALFLISFVVWRPSIPGIFQSIITLK